MKNVYKKQSVFLPLRAELQIVFDKYLRALRWLRIWESMMKQIGEEVYNAEQGEKRQLLDRLLAKYNDGRKKTLFCLAVNLQPLDELKVVFENGDLDLPLKERGRLMEKRLKEKSGVELKLRRKRRICHIIIVYIA